MKINRFQSVTIFFVFACISSGINFVFAQDSYLKNLLKTPTKVDYGEFVRQQRAALDRDTYLFEKYKNETRPLLEDMTPDYRKKVEDDANRTADALNQRRARQEKMEETLAKQETEAVPENGAKIKDIKDYNYTCNPDDPTDIKVGKVTMISQDTLVQGMRETQKVLAPKGSVGMPKKGDVYVAQEKDFDKAAQLPKNERAYGNKLKQKVKKPGDTTKPKPECVPEGRFDLKPSQGKKINYVPPNN